MYDRKAPKLRLQLSQKTSLSLGAVVESVIPRTLVNRDILATCIVNDPFIIVNSQERRQKRKLLGSGSLRASQTALRIAIPLAVPALGLDTFQNATVESVESVAVET